MFVGEEVERSYTPVCSLGNSGVHRHPPPAKAAAISEPPAPPAEGETIDLMIKLYQDGKMSRYLSSLKKGIITDNFYLTRFGRCVSRCHGYC